MRPGAHPLHCQATCQDAQSDDDDAARVAVKKSAKSKRLDMVKWVAAYDAWALAAASVGCLPYTAAKAHFRIALQVSCEHVQRLLAVCSGLARTFHCGRPFRRRKEAPSVGSIL